MMISVGRKGVAQGYSSSNNRRGGVEDDETELEEGEACSYQEDCDPSIDPDVALSYIDEKLQSVLGHFKKDFEGVVSAESLGAKFGIYGSFLPSYRRSPVWSHSRSPPRVQNHHPPQSPSALPVEAGHHNSLAPANVSHSMKLGSASAGSASSNAYKQSLQKDPCRQNAVTQSTPSVDERTPKSEVRDRRTLKVRIKVGSENLSVKKNAALYSGLGLDGSPSSSLDDGPVEGEGLSSGPPFESLESPTQILRIMTSSPLLGDRLLSPLSDDLMQLSVKLKKQQSNVTQPSSKVDWEISGVRRSSCSVEENKAISGENSMLCLDKKASFSVDKRDSKDRYIGLDLPLKESDLDSLSCEELVCNALKLPLLSDEYSNIKDYTGASPREKLYSSTAKREPLEPNFFSNSLSEQPNGKGKARDVLDDRTAGTLNEMVTYSVKVVDRKSETANNLANTESVESKFGKTSETEMKDPQKQRTDQSTLCGDGMVLPRGKEKLSLGDKKRRRKGHVNGFAAGKLAVESANDGAQVPKDRKIPHPKYPGSRTEVERSSVKDLNEVRDRYADFFGNIDDQEGEAMDSPVSKERLKTSEVIEKATVAYENTSREMTSSVETRIDKTSERKSSIDTGRVITSETHTRGPTTDGCLPENSLPVSDPAAVNIVTDDKWVQCDKCQKWRLLPPGSNPKSLPEKWLCRMQTWLPTMNRCGISEAESNEAFRARYQLLPEIPNSLYPLDRLATSIPSADHSGPIVSTDGEGMGKLEKKSKSSSQDSLNRGRSSSKKKQESGKERTSKDFQLQTKSNDTYLQTSQHLKVEKHIPDCYSDGGHSKSPMVKGKRDLEQKSPVTSKRSKTRSTQSGDNKRATSGDHGNEMLGISSENGLRDAAAGKDQMTKYRLLSSHSLKDDMNDKSPDTSGNSELHVKGFPAASSMHVSKSVGVNVTPKKRKGDSFKYPPAVKLVDDNEQVSRKRHRMSKPGEIEPSANKRNSKADKKSKNTSKRSLDNNESLQKDSTGVIAAATSSSSKVSGSLKIKSKFLEVKGSPVESVSSSPLRSSNLDKLSSGGEAIVETANVQDAVKLMRDSPGKRSHGDFEDSSDHSRSISAALRKEAFKTESENGSLEPVIDVQDKINGVLLHKTGNGSAESLEPDIGYLSKERNLNSCVNETVGGEGPIDASVSLSGKTWMNISSSSKNKNQIFNSNSEKGKVNMCESYDKPRDDTPVHEARDRDRNVEVLKNSHCADDKADNGTIWNNHEPSIPKSIGKQEHDEKRSSKMFDVEKSEDTASISMKEKSRYLAPSDGSKDDMLNSPQPRQGNDISTSYANGRPNDFPKEPRPYKKVDGQNGTHHVLSKHSMANGHRIRNQDAPSPLRRDSSSHAASSLIKEATNLKHLADRMKQATESPERIGFYFEAALKFLHGAYLLESKNGDIGQAINIYRSTTHLCQFCAHEYERVKDMGTAVLAYKCMEVAYLRVVYLSHNIAKQARYELQTVLQMVPPGESPSSSASDIDNLNNTATGDKACQTRSAESPQLSGTLVIASKNLEELSKLLSFSRDVNLAMEASRKSRTAFAAANVSLDQDKSKDCIASIKRALDFNFHDMEGLLRLVRLAKEATGR